ncbi:MAG: argininosuccinate synthase, partial [Cyanobacteria bacterium MAG APA_bin_95]|nr:argininosuccinate synthase [Cyanobacteria bacterium MAG APA_bin_95]
SIEAGRLEDPWLEPPADVYDLTCKPEAAPDEAAVVEVGFAQGNPVTLDGQSLDPVTLIRQVNVLAGTHGYGRIDMIEDRVVGIKSREIYETPGMLLLIRAHQELESICLAADVMATKRQLEQRWAELVYRGLWFGPLKQALDGFLDVTRKDVNGRVRLRLYKGSCTVIGREASHGLYDMDLATYGREDTFDHRAAAGFVYVWGLATRLWASRHL